MNTKSARVIAPPRSPTKWLPAVVGLCTAGLLAWSLWPIVQPAKGVQVAQAVFDRTAQASPDTRLLSDVPSVPTVQAPGWLEADPFLVACTSLADGIVESIDVLEGDYVEQGQIVATLVAEDAELMLQRAEASLQAAEAELARNRADLAAAQLGWEEPVSLERNVETGRAALAESRAELAQLPSVIEAAQATLVGLQEEAGRARVSQSQGATNELEVIIADQRALAQRSEVRALEARAPILQARVERLEADLRAAERDLSLRIEDRRRLDAALADTRIAEAAVAGAIAARDEAALELERMTIRAPISGFVQRRLKIPGDKVLRAMDSLHSAHLVHLYDPSKIQVRVDVPLADASHIYKGQPCEIIVDVLPDRVFQGEVTRILHEADLQKNTLQIKVRVLDPDPILRPEMLTRVKFLGSDRTIDDRSAGGTRAESVIVPERAIGDNNGSDALWLVIDRHNERGSIRIEPVEVVSTDDGMARVRGEVNAGAIVVVDPTAEIQPGDSVRVTGGAS